MTCSFACLSRSLIVCVVIGLLPLSSFAQEAKPKVEATPAVKVEGKAKAAPKGRLPAHYKEVVTEEQKQQIYDVNAKYATEIEALAEKMKAAVAKRDAEIEALLSADQKAKVAKLKEEAAAKKKATAATKEAKPATPATPATTTVKPATAAK